MAAGDLTTLAKVKGYVQGLDQADATFDEVLGRIIAAVSAQFVSESGMVPTSTAYTEKRSGHGMESMTLRHAPVISVTSVSVDGVAVPAQPSVGSSGWVLDGSTVRLVGYVFTEGTLNVSIVYTAGYAAIPADIEQAVIKMVGLQFTDRKRIGQSSLSAGGESISYSDGATLAYWNTIVEAYSEQAI